MKTRQLYKALVFLSILFLAGPSHAQAPKGSQAQPYTSDRVRGINADQETPPPPPPPPPVTDLVAEGPRYEVIIKHSNDQRDSWIRSLVTNSDTVAMPYLRVRSLADLDNMEILVSPGRWCQGGCQVRTSLRLMADDAFRGADPSASAFPMQSVVNRIPSIGIDPRVNVDGHAVRELISQIVSEDQITNAANRTVRLNAILEISRNQEVDMLDAPMTMTSRFSILIQMNSESNGFSFDERPWPWTKDF